MEQYSKDQAHVHRVFALTQSIGHVFFVLTVSLPVVFRKALLQLPACQKLPPTAHTIVDDVDELKEAEDLDDTGQRQTQMEVTMYLSCSFAFTGDDVDHYGSWASQSTFGIRVSASWSVRARIGARFGETLPARIPRRGRFF